METFWRVYEKITIAIWVAIVLPPLILCVLLADYLDAKDEAQSRQ
jgi:hypothetical protein